jgi:hypothetical protein
VPFVQPGCRSLEILAGKPPHRVPYFPLLAAASDSYHRCPFLLWSQTRSTPWPWYSSPESLPHHPFTGGQPWRCRTSPLGEPHHIINCPPNRWGHLTSSLHAQELDQGSRQPPHCPTSPEHHRAPMSSAISDATSPCHASVLVTLSGCHAWVPGASW